MSFSLLCLTGETNFPWQTGNIRNAWFPTWAVLNIVFLDLAPSPTLCKDNSKYSPLTSYLQPLSSLSPDLKLMTLFLNSLRKDTASDGDISSSHLQSDTPLCVRTYSFSFLFQWVKFSIPVPIIWTPPTSPEYFINLLSFPSLILYICQSIGFFLST